MPVSGSGVIIGAVDRAKRRLDGSAAGIDGAAVRNCMADRAVAKGGKLLAARDGCGRKHRGIRPRDRRDRPPWQHGSGDTECCGTKDRNSRQRATPLGKRIFPDIGRNLRCGRRDWQHDLFGTLITPHPRKNALGRKRQFAKTHPGRIKDGVGNRRGAWD